MDRLSLLVIANRQYLEGLITSQELKWKWIECIGDASDEDMTALADVISTNDIHLRASH